MLDHFGTSEDSCVFSADPTARHLFWICFVCPEWDIFHRKQVWFLNWSVGKRKLWHLAAFALWSKFHIQLEALWHHQCPIHWPWSSLTWLRQYVSRGESKYQGPATVVGVTSGAAQPLKASLVSIKGNHLCEIPSWSWLTCHRNWFVWGQSQTHFAKLTITCVTGCVLFFFEQFDHFNLVSLSTM